MSDLLTPRQYLVSLGLAKAGRGKFSKEAHAALDAAKAKGMTFAEPVKPTPKPKSEAKPKIIVSGEPKRRGRPPKVQDKPKISQVLANPVKPAPILRKQETRFAISPEGARIGYSMCFAPNCLNSISRCACKNGPQPPKGAIIQMGYPKV